MDSSPDSAHQDPNPNPDDLGDHHRANSGAGEGGTFATIRDICAAIRISVWMLDQQSSSGLSAISAPIAASLHLSSTSLSHLASPRCRESPFLFNLGIYPWSSASAFV